MVSFELTPEQKEIQQAAHKFAEEVIRPAERELDLLPNPEDVFKSDLFWEVLRKAYELGYHRMGIPEEMGGLHKGTMDDQITGLIVGEEFAWGGLGFALAILVNSVPHTNITMYAPDRKDLIEKFVRPFCEDETGKNNAAWPITEPDAGSDVLNYVDCLPVKVSAKKKGDKYIINGTKSNWASGGGYANLYVTYVNVDPELGMRGNAAFVIPADLPGISTGKPVDKIGTRCLNQVPVYFDNVEVPEEYMILEPDRFVDLTRRYFGFSNSWCGIACVGVARAAFEHALSYAKERIQGGKPIFEHQAIALKLQEMATLIEACRVFTWKAMWENTNAFINQLPPRIDLGFGAKIFGAEMGLKVASEAVQIMGGYGLTKEYPVEKLLRDIKCMAICDGTSETLGIVAARTL